MLYNMKDLLAVAKEHNFAVGAFNISDANMFRAVVEQAEASQAPAIIAVHPDELSFISDEFCKYLIERIKNSKIPFVLHLDHGGSVEDVLRAIQCGFSSVMIDGSLLDYDENVRITRQVVKLAHPLGISVEGELGTIGDTGTSIEGGVTEITYTEPDQAQDFIDKTGVDTLAIAIGTAHGIYPKDFVPELKLDLLEEIVKVVDVPLVLHGGSSNPDEEIRRAVKIGIEKINISSDIKKAYFEKLDSFFDSDTMWEPNVLYPPCIEATKEVVLEKMNLFDSINKAKLYC